MVALILLLGKAAHSAQRQSFQYFARVPHSLIGGVLFLAMTLSRTRKDFCVLQP
jgi:hypothetical protein